MLIIRKSFNSLGPRDLDGILVRFGGPAGFYQASPDPDFSWRQRVWTFRGGGGFGLFVAEKGSGLFRDNDLKLFLMRKYTIRVVNIYHSGSENTPFWRQKYTIRVANIHQSGGENTPLGL